MTTTDSSPVAHRDEPGEVIIEVSQLTKTFGDLVAVEDATFDVFDGEFFSIIGPSGSGKTTLLRMIAGFEEPSSGTVAIGGEDCTYAKPYHRSTNMIFQDLALFPHLNVRENIEYGLIEAGIDKEEREEKVRAVLRTVDLEGYQSRPIGELSGGEQQRVALARGLVNEPSVLLLDEPLASLDEKLKETMKVELKRIQERTDITFIYVTHDQEVAMAMSDRIAIIRDGEIQQVASPRDMYRHPTNSFVADFTGAENIFDVAEWVRDGEYGTVTIGDVEIRSRIADNVDDDAPTEAQLIIRPETISVSKADGRVSGTVTDLVYKGALVDVIVDVDFGHEVFTMRAEVHDAEVEGISQGDEISLAWSDDAPRVVKRG